MTNQTTITKLEKALGEFADKMILKTILETLSADDVKKFLDLLLANKYTEAERLVTEKIPDLEAKINQGSQKTLKDIFSRNQKLTL